MAFQLIAYFGAAAGKSICRNLASADAFVCALRRQGQPRMGAGAVVRHEKRQWLKAVRSAGVEMAVLACVAMWSLAVVAADAQQGGGSAVPKVTVVAANGQRVSGSPSASEFTTVFPGGGGAVNHADAPILITLSQHLKVHLGERVEIHTTLAARSVYGALGLGEVRSPDRSRRVRAARLDPRGHRWALVVPRNSGRVDRLRIEVSYRHGGAGYEAGIRLLAPTAR